MQGTSTCSKCVLCPIAIPAEHLEASWVAFAPQSPKHGVATCHAPFGVAPTVDMIDCEEWLVIDSAAGAAPPVCGEDLGAQLGQFAAMALAAAIYPLRVCHCAGSIPGTLVGCQSSAILIGLLCATFALVLDLALAQLWVLPISPLRPLRFLAALICGSGHFHILSTMTDGIVGGSILGRHVPSERIGGVGPITAEGYHGWLERGVWREC
jgi:hypothetical protein